MLYSSWKYEIVWIRRTSEIKERESEQSDLVSIGVQSFRNQYQIGYESSRLPIHR